MRSRYTIQDIQISLYRMKVAKGELLKDVPLEDLAPEYRAELARDASVIHHQTKLAVRRVWRGKKKVWRFIDKET
jgi:ribosome recycling factor